MGAARLYRANRRLQERRLNRLPQFMASIAGQAVHFVHLRGVGPSPMPILITHGWPGSFVEMERLIPLLAYPAAHGGDPADAFDVVVPSLPGYGFSPPPTKRGKVPTANWKTRLEQHLIHPRKESSD